MTAIGMVVNRDSAMIWADTACFDDRGIVGHVAKLIVNPTGRLAAAGTGWHSLLHCADCLVMGAISLDRLVEQLPARLRWKGAECAQRQPEPESFGGNRYIVAGWSDEFRQIVGYLLSADRYFEPEICRIFTSPESSDLASMGAETPDDIEPATIEQIADLRRHHRCEIPGRVVIATVRPEEVTARVLLELGQPGPPLSRQERAVAPETRT